MNVKIITILTLVILDYQMSSMQRREDAKSKVTEVAFGHMITIKVAEEKHKEIKSI